MKPFTIRAKLMELRRERALRKKVYPAFINRGQLTINDARYQIAIVDDMIRDYERLAGIEPGDSLFKDEREAAPTSGKLWDAGNPDDPE